MSALSATKLLDLWDRGHGLPPGQRALALLATVSGTTETEAAERPVAECDRTLRAARQRWFGKRIIGRTDCPECGEATEVEFDLDALNDDATIPPHTWLQAAGCEVKWRPPTAGDLASISALPSTAVARAELLRHCVLEVQQGGQALAPQDWPAEIIQVVEQALEANAQGTEDALDLSCPACSRNWMVPFDLSAFLWFEIANLAHGLLRDVHRLAQAYGWREADVLAMSSVRRAMYLDLCGP